MLFRSRHTFWMTNIFFHYPHALMAFGHTQRPHAEGKVMEIYENEWNKKKKKQEETRELRVQWKRFFHSHITFLVCLNSTCYGILVNNTRLESNKRFFYHNSGVYESIYLWRILVVEIVYSDISESLWTMASYLGNINFQIYLCSRLRSD